jgi:5-hydroxyisourate hydrolase-like protein (transthyretin family)
MRFASCLLSLAFVAAVQTQTPVVTSKASISGIVSSRTGEPLKGVKIDASSVGGKTLGKALHFVETDSSGRYEISNLEFGVYRVFAQNESMGYPNTHLDFYGGNAAPKVTLDEKHPNSEVNIIMPAVAGKIRGTVLDRASNRPVQNVSIKLSKVEAPGWISTSFPVKNSLSVPPDLPFNVQVTADGYKEWKSQSPLLVRSGQELRLDVILEPLGDQSKR